MDGGNDVRRETLRTTETPSHSWVKLAVTN